MKHFLSDDILLHITSALESKFAFHVTKSRFADLDRAVGAAAKHFGITPAAIADTVCNANCPDALMDVIVRHVTVGETYFFRHSEQFEAVEKYILPGLVARQRASGKKRITLWSAGCSTGEEAYSLAILITRAIPDYKEWSISIIATDINGKSLDLAAEGVYRDWSFRGLDSAFKATYFEALADTPSSVDSLPAYRIRDDLRPLVTFLPLNIASASWQVPGFPSASFDIVFCRNVLMYFQRPVAVGILGAIRERMTKESCLVVAPSEASMAHAAGFQTLRFPDCTLFKVKDPSHSDRRGHRAIVTQVEPVSTVTISADRGVQTTAHAPDARSPQKPAAKAPALAHSSKKGVAGASLAELAHAAADAGDHARARELADRAIAENPTEHSAHYLHAMMALEKGELDEAYAALVRTIFLQPDFVPALIAMGNITRQQGRHEEAARNFRTAITALESMDPAAIVSGSGGLTAGILLQMAKALRGTGK